MCVCVCVGGGGGGVGANEVYVQWEGRERGTVCDFVRGERGVFLAG